jgi:hypothetical protein
LAVLHFLGAKKTHRMHFFPDETKECALNINIFYKKNYMHGINDYVRYIPFYSYVFLSIIFSFFLENKPSVFCLGHLKRHFLHFFSS